jgi:hypothetical protein
MCGITAFARIETGEFYHPGLLPEQWWDRCLGRFMAFGINDGISGMVIVEATPFEMCQKTRVVIPEIFYSHPAILGSMA